MLVKYSPPVKRKKTAQIKLGNVLIGGGAPVVIQSMTNTDTRDVQATVAQIQQLTEAGCEVVRVAVPDTTAAQAIGEIKKEIRIPWLRMFTLITDWR